MTTCTHCNGTGCEDPDDFNTICIECAGRGVDPTETATAVELMEQENLQTCEMCEGAGLCSWCDRGRVIVRTVTVRARLLPVSRQQP